MKQKPFPFRIDEDIFKEVRKESKEKGVSINKLLNLKLKGFKITKEWIKKELCLCMEWWLQWF